MIKHSETALVSGANRGIGMEIVRQLALREWKVFLGSRDLARGEQAAAKLGFPRDQVLPLQLDLDDPASLDQIAERMGIGRLDVLINNAAVMPPDRGTDRVDPEEVRATLDTNTLGALRLTQKVLPLLRKGRDARIINISSGMGALSEMGGGYTSYRLSKVALNGLSLMMAHDLAPIKVFALCPGWVKTDMGGAGAQRTVEKGAETAIWLATAAEAESGKFYRDRKVIPW